MVVDAEVSAEKSASHHCFSCRYKNTLTFLLLL